jgi:hypothetical protein
VFIGPDSYQSKLYFDNGSYQTAINFGSGSYQFGLTFDNASYQNTVDLQNNDDLSKQEYFSFTNRSAQNNIVIDSSVQEFFTFNSGYQSNINLNKGQSFITIENGSQTNGFSDSQDTITIKGYDLDWSTYPSVAQNNFFFIHDLPNEQTSTLIGKKNNRLVEVSDLYFDGTKWVLVGDIQIGGITATTYGNLPIDVSVTGGTYNSGTSTITFTNNTGGTFTVTGITATGSSFTGGTVTGASNFTGGLTANTISATTYENLPTIFETDKMLIMYRAGSAAAVISFGTALALSFSVAATARTLAATNDYTKKQRVGLVTAAVAGSLFNYRVPTQYFIPTGIEYYEQTIGTAENSATAGMRCVFGITSDVGVLSTSIEYDTILNYIGVCRLSTSDNWHIVHNDNTGLATTVDLGASFPANISDEQFKLRITPLTSTSVTVTFTRLSNGQTTSQVVSSDIPSLDVRYTIKGALNNNANALAYGLDWFAANIKFN